MEARYWREQYKSGVRLLTSLLLNLGLTSLFGIVWYRSYADVIIQPFFRKGNWLVIGIYALLMHIFVQLYGGYRVGHLKRGEALFSVGLAVVFVNTITYLQISLIGRKFMDAVPIVVMTILDGIWIVLWVVITDKIYKKYFPAHQMLLIYGNRSAERLIYKVNERSDKYDICEAVEIAQGLDEVYRHIDRFHAVIICDVEAGDRNQILKYCYEHSVRTYLTPNISDMLIRGADTIHLFDTPLLLCKGQGFTLEQRMLKRALDIALCLFTAAVTWPVMLILAAAIKLYDGGPVIFKQVRWTLDKKAFYAYKFRSMRVDAEEDGAPVLAAENDDRITPVGRFIRRFRLDELPQLLNILKGDMSIVGPRPERPEIAVEHEKEMPEFAFRTKVKAGLTGYAQVMGKYNTSAYDKLKLDLMYIENYSFLMDLKIIMMTVKILLLPGSTQGVSEQPVTAATAEEQWQKL